MRDTCCKKSKQELHNKLRRRFRNIISRCKANNKLDLICEEWLSDPCKAADWLEEYLGEPDMGTKLVRLDNNKGYEPNNLVYVY